MLCRHLLADLQILGFAVNPYDTYTTNKAVKVQKFTIVWNVDNLMLSHADAE